MKTTLNISDQVMRKLKEKAARTGRTMSELVEAALRESLLQRKELRGKITLPSFNGGRAAVDVTNREFVSTLLTSPGITILTETELHAQVADRFFQQHRLVSGNLVFDAHTAILMAEHGITRIYTRDTYFHRFPSIEVIDPLA